MNQLLSETQNKLYSKYQKLEKREQLLLEILSVNYTSINQSKIIEYFNSLPESLRGKKLQIAEFKTIIQKLNKNSLITYSAYYYNCKDVIVELVTQNSVLKGSFPKIAEVIKKNTRSFFAIDSMEATQLGRIVLYEGNPNIFDEIIGKYRGIYLVGWKDAQLFVCSTFNILNNPFNPEFLEAANYSEEFIQDFFYNSLVGSIEFWEFVPTATLDYIREKYVRESVKIIPGILNLLLESLLFQGKYSEFEEIANKYKNQEESIIKFSTLGLKSFLQGNMEEAIQLFESEISNYKKKGNNRVNYFTSYKSIIHFFALLKLGESDNYKKAIEYSKKISKDKKHNYFELFQLLHSACIYLSGKDNNKEKIKYKVELDDTFWNIFSFALVVFWIERGNISGPWEDLQDTLTRVRLNGYRWQEMQILDLLEKSSTNKKDKNLPKLKNKFGSFSLSDIVEKKAEWKLALNALASLKSKTKQSESSETTIGSKRLVWIVDFNEKYQTCSIQPVEQTFQKKGWSEGRNIALKRLSNNAAQIPFLSELDHKVINYIEAFSTGYYGGVEYVIDDDAIIALVGHPLVFRRKGLSHLDVIKGEPELQITENSKTTLKISLHPKRRRVEDKFVLKLETPSQLKVTYFTPEHEKIYQILGESGMVVPKQAKDEVLESVTSLSGLVTIQSDIMGEGNVNIETVEPVSLPHVHLLPYQAGLKILILCRPFGSAGPYYKPYQGGKNLIVEISGKKLQTTRNFEEEEAQVQNVLTSCPSLYSENKESDLVWYLEDPESCLQTLMELQEMGDQICLAWPEGEIFRLKNRVDTSNFHLSIKQNNDWFGISGDLEVDDNKVMEIQNLLELLDQSPGKFLKMDDGSFLALTERFRKQLEEIKTYTESSKSGIRFSPLVAPIFEELATETASLKADKAWKNHIQKLQEVKNYKPSLPNTFQAELRDYQYEGFEWMARLAHWKVGACLADDMGLGKTIQALSILLMFANSGPSLIVAPTSVCMNWHTESSRFAPTLNTIQFGSGDREKMLKGLKPFDLLVCSYGMIQQQEVADLLKQVKWQVIVLDEAQAIKNMTTKRSQAVMNLQGEFKLITTGTPIENHLGELWNLFRFLNPSLLGSLDKFNEKYAIPIEKYKDKASRYRLKKLIQPFILRRSKNDVLEELPERTDIVLQVELSEEEKAFYEALRQSALKKLSDEKLQQGQKYLQILAEIMKLRRACCHSSLVDKKLQIPSSKFETFTEIIEELLENKHKALVFSQFVDHLSLIKAHLEKLKVPFQYLDGSTPLKEREKRVKAFQSGEGEVFLISLKAGGTGLNLTAADYVIHMDPWWNPAVEDQASDRAHRIGQKRPVTVYKLVAKGTIEEKIIDLHKHKRDLADSLLEETDMSGKISSEELLNLLKESSKNE